MTDTEIIEWIEAHPEVLADISVQEWSWFDSKDGQLSRGWTRAASFRECIEKLKEQHGK